MSNPYKGMPTTLRIGCYEFRVEVQDFEDAETDRAFGHMQPSNQKIRLRPGMTPRNLANTFIHEVMHALHFFMATGNFLKYDEPLDPHAVEEEFVLKGANGLCMFWQDNPKACAWWTVINNSMSVE
jgi:hypothetical protein